MKNRHESTLRADDYEHVQLHVSHHAGSDEVERKAVCATRMGPCSFTETPSKWDRGFTIPSVENSSIHEQRFLFA